MADYAVVNELKAVLKIAPIFFLHSVWCDPRPVHEAHMVDRAAL